MVGWLSLHERLNSSIAHVPEMQSSVCVKYVYTRAREPASESRTEINTTRFSIDASGSFNVKDVVRSGYKASWECLGIAMFNIDADSNTNVHEIVDIPDATLANMLMVDLMGKDVIQMVPSLSMFHHLTTIFVFYTNKITVPRKTRRVHFNMHPTRRLRLKHHDILQG